MPFSLTPKDSSFYPLFTASAENLVAATDVLSDFIHDHARRPELAGTDGADRVAEGATVADLLTRLDPDRREAFVLTQIVGLPYAEAAEVAGCPVGTIRSRVARARADLVASLSRVTDDDRRGDAGHA